MARRLVTSDLIAEVRSLIDENNTESVNDEADIIPALNRAQDVCANILARHYESPLIKQATVEAVAGQSDYDIPEDAFEDRLEKVEVIVNGYFYSLKRINYRDIAEYQVPVSQQIPAYYCIIGRKFRVINSPSGTYDFRIWYMQDPKPLVKEQGRITLVNEAGNYIRVDEVGSELSSLSDEFESFVNVVDGDSGTIKATVQIQSIVDNKITFKSSPTMSTFMGQTVESDITGLEFAVNDYICVATGTCIMFLKKPLSTYVIQYAAAEMVKKLGGSADMELRILQDLEKIVEHSWVGRQQSLRVKKVNAHWGGLSRRYLPLGEP